MRSDEAYPKPALNLNEKPPRRFEVEMTKLFDNFILDLQKVQSGEGVPKSRAAMANMELTWCAMLGALYGGSWQMLPKKEGEIRIVQCRPQSDAYASLAYPHKTAFETLGSDPPHKLEGAKVFKAPSQLLVDLDDDYGSVMGDLQE